LFSLCFDIKPAPRISAWPLIQLLFYGLFASGRPTTLFRTGWDSVQISVGAIVYYPPVIPVLISGIRSLPHIPEKKAKTRDEMHAAASSRRQKTVRRKRKKHRF